MDKLKKPGIGLFHRPPPERKKDGREPVRSGIAQEAVR